MTEEAVTLAFAAYCVRNHGEILSLDYPHAGTGILLHGNSRTGKSKGSIKPDVIARFANELWVMESKPNYSADDVVKLTRLRGGEFDAALKQFGSDLVLKVGIVLLDRGKNRARLQAVRSVVDIGAVVDLGGTVDVIFL